MMIWILFIGTMGLSLWAMWRVKSVYQRYSPGLVRYGLTGSGEAAQILRRCDIRDVEFTHAHGRRGGHYDPTHKRLALSPVDYHGRSPAAPGLAAHECGHAIQHAPACRAAFITSPADFPLHLAPPPAGGTRTRN